MDPNFFNTINNLLEQKGNQYSPDDLFGVISIITLLKIISLQDNKATSFLPDSSEKKRDHSPGLNDISQLLNQFSGRKDNNLQQLLPLLLQTLGSSYGPSDMQNEQKTNNNSNEEKTKNPEHPDQKNEKQKKKLSK